MASIAFITYSQNPNLTSSDALLAGTLKDKGFSVSAVAWDKPTDWKEYQSLILRSCWNYHEKYDQFLEWLYLIEQLKIPTWNPISLIRWNSHKFYLADLEKKGIVIPPTEFVKKKTTIDIQLLSENNNWDDIVIKPAIGASAYKIARFRISELSKAQSYTEKLLETSDMLIQKCLPEILSDGEYSLIFFGNQFSHAVNKKPKSQDYRTNVRFGAKEALVHLPDSIINQAINILDNLDTQTLYTRIDGYIQDGKFILMELELIEPRLFIEKYTESAILFADTFSQLTKK